MEKIFISYSHTDSSVADSITQVLEDMNLPYFRDIKDIGWGDKITNSVRDGIGESIAIIVIISPGSLKSHWVSYEVGYATALKKKVLPYLTHPSIDPPGFLSDLLNISSEQQVRDFFHSIPNLKTSDIHSEKNNEISKQQVQFNNLATKMNALFLEMKEDLSAEENQFVREFVALQGGTVFSHSGKQRFEYRSNVHRNLFNQVDLLVEYGFVKIAKKTNTSIYRMTEEFVNFLLAYDIDKK